MRFLVACALILAPLTFATAHAASVVPNLGQSAKGVISVKSDRYVSKDCSPVNGPYGFYGSIFCRPTEGEYLRNLGSNWPQKKPEFRTYKNYILGW